jgi:hypothetical protein
VCQQVEKDCWKLKKSERRLKFDPGLNLNPCVFIEKLTKEKF